MTEYNRSIRFWSVISGVSLLVMAVAAGVAYGFIFNSFYVEGNAAATTMKIQANTGLYYTGAALWCLIFITDLIVTYGFYRFLRPLNKPLAYASGILRLIYSFLLGLAIIFLLLKKPGDFVWIWSAGLLIFGFHLIATGIAVMSSTVFLKVLGVLLIVAGAGYSLISGIQTFFPQATELVQTLESVLVVPMTVGELAFGIWLLIRGGKNLSRQASDHHVQGAV